MLDKPPKPEFVIRTFQEGLDACGQMGRIIEYIRKQYSDSMTRDEAQAHVDARVLLINRVNALLDEMELEYCFGDIR